MSSTLYIPRSCTLSPVLHTHCPAHCPTYRTGAAPPHQPRDDIDHNQFQTRHPSESSLHSVCSSYPTKPHLPRSRHRVPSQQRLTPPTQKRMETLSRIGTALTAGCGATLCVHPLDVVRVNLQVDSTGVGKRVYNGTFDCIQKIAARDGAKGLVRLVVPRRDTRMIDSQARSLTCVHTQHTRIAHPTPASHILHPTSYAISPFAPHTPPQPPPHPLAVRRVERGDPATDDVRRPAHGDIPNASGHGKG